MGGAELCLDGGGVVRTYQPVLHVLQTLHVNDGITQRPYGGSSLSLA